MVNPIAPIARVAQVAGKTVRQAMPSIKVPSSIKARMAERATLFPMAHPAFELPLATLIALGFFYEQGKSDRTGEPQHAYFKEAAQVAAEGLITSGVVQNLSGIYPTVTLAKMVYDIGHSQTNSQRTEAVIRNTLLSTSGYFGIYFVGQALSDYLHRRDADRFLRHMQGIQTEAIQSLKQQTLRFVEADFGSKGIKELTNGFLKAQQQFLDHIDTLPKSLLNEPLGKLVSDVRMARNVSFLRWLNPAFGYILTMTLVGLPLTKAVVKLGENTGLLDKGTWQHHRPMLWLPFAVNHMDTAQPDAPQNIMEV